MTSFFDSLLNSATTLFATEEPTPPRQQPIQTTTISLSRKPKPHILKVCFGDVVIVSVKIGEARVPTKCIGTVCYIGYPFPYSTVRYGIKLKKAFGDHTGTLHLDRKGRIASKKSRGKPRQYFDCKKKHGIFVKKERILEITRKQKDRISVEDYVNVKFRGPGYISFIGQLEHTQGYYTWYGIELDARKGRHNGTIMKVRYFDCKHQHGLHCRIVHGITLVDQGKPGGKTIGSARTLSRSQKMAASSRKIRMRRKKSRRQKAIQKSKRRLLKSKQNKSQVPLRQPNIVTVTSLDVHRNSHVSGSGSASKSSQNVKGDTNSSLAGNKYGSAAQLQNHFSAGGESAANLRRDQTTSVTYGYADGGADTSGRLNWPRAPSTSIDSRSTRRTSPRAVMNNINLPSVPDLFGLGGADSLEPLISGRSMKRSALNKSTRVLTDTDIDNRKFEDIYDYNEFEDEVGEGEFGVVYKCRKRAVVDDQTARTAGATAGANGNKSIPLTTQSTNPGLYSSMSIMEESESDDDAIDAYHNRQFGDTDYSMVDPNSMPTSIDHFHGDYEDSDEEEDGDVEIATTASTIYDMGDMDFEDDSDSDSIHYPGEDDQGNGNHDAYDSDMDDANAEDNVFAVKKIKKSKFHHLAHRARSEHLNGLRKEIGVMRKIQRLKKIRPEKGSAYLIDLVDVFEDRNFIYIVTNFCSGGNLWKYVQKFGENHDTNDEHKDDADTSNCSEQELQRVMKQMLESIHFLHKHDVAHLDLKPDNVVFAVDPNTKENIVQIIDFGISSMIPPLTKGKMIVGTPNFIAPEILRGYYDIKADIWSLGVIFFLMRYGFPPFFCEHHQIVDFADDNEALYKKIQEGFDPVVKEGLGAYFPKSYYVDDQRFEYEVGDEFRSLLTNMLTVNLERRYTVSECLDHPYFSHLASDKELPRTVLDAFSKFNGMCQFRVMIARMFAHQIEPQQQKELEKLWKKFDTDGDGKITMRQFADVMKSYEHGYEDYQIEAIFESLDHDETDTIDYASLLTAYSYQRLVATDERLWDAFAQLDKDGDGQITKMEIKAVLATLDPAEFKAGVSLCSKIVHVDEATQQKHNNQVNEETLTPKKRPSHIKSFSSVVNDGLMSADWDDNGTIDYEEFLRSLHPEFTETAVTPPAMADDQHIAMPDTAQIHQNAQYNKSRRIADSAMALKETDTFETDTSFTEDDVNQKSRGSLELKAADIDAV